MIEHKTEKKIEGLNKSEDTDMEILLNRLLVQKSDLLYFICRRGSWDHKKQRGKKIAPFDPRGILKDREIDCKKLAKTPLNKVSKNINLIRAMSRKNWKKSMHLMPARNCGLTSYGKKFYKYLLRKKMVKYIEKNYNVVNYEDFFNAFIINFNLPLAEDDIRRYEEEKRIERIKKRIDIQNQEKINGFPLNNSNFEEICKSHNNNDENFFRFNSPPIPISSEDSKLIHDGIIKTVKISNEQVLNLLSIEEQTILDIINNSRIISKWFTIALLTKLNELASLKIIEHGLKNGKKSWRLKNF